MHINNKELYLRLLTYLRPYLPLFFIGLAATIIQGATQPAIAALMKPLLDGAFVEKNPEMIFWTPLLLVGLFTLRGIAGFINSMSFAWVSSKMVMNFRIKMFDQVLSLPTTFFDNTTVGQIISKFTNDVTQVTASATSVLITLVRDSVTIIGLIGWMFYIDWQLSLLLFALIPFIAVLVTVLGKRLRVLNRELQKRFGDLNHVLSEGIRGQQEVKIYGGQDYENTRFDKTANWVRRYQMKVKAASAMGVPLVEIVSAVVMAGIIYLSTNQIASEQMTVGEFMSFFAALGLLLTPIKRLTHINEPLQRSLAAAESVFGLLDETTENDSGKSNDKLKLLGNIEFKAINFAYTGAEKLAIKNLSLSIQQGQTVAFVGASGSGKTSLANLLPRLYEIQSGEITIDQHNIKDISLRTLRENISLVSQNVMLFNDTLSANITYGSATIDEKKLLAAVQAANASEFINKMTDGLATHIGENGVKLSGGQRQRIAIARAIYKDAPILILDEATSALDNESEQQVQEALDNLKKDRTTLIIAHRLSTIQNADRIIVMSDGEIVESGTHEELLASKGEYWQLQNT